MLRRKYLVQGALPRYRHAKAALELQLPPQHLEALVVRQWRHPVRQPRGTHLAAATTTTLAKASTAATAAAAVVVIIAAVVAIAAADATCVRCAAAATGVVLGTTRSCASDAE